MARYRAISRSIVDEVAGICKSIAHELRNQCTLGRFIALYCSVKFTVIVV